MGLSLDIMLAFPQMNEVAEFARAVPEVSIILNHLGGVSRTGIYAGKDDRNHPGMARGHRRGRPEPQRHLQAGRHGYAPLGVRLALPRHPHRLRGAGGGHGPVG